MNFKQYGYSTVKNVISNELRDFITQYALFDEMQAQHYKGDGQVPNSHVKYADPCMETLLLNLLPTMEENTGLKLLPTYSYYRVYRPGHELHVHKDRPSCEISATLCFNFNYENYAWPIFMAGNKIVQAPGDLVIYRGHELEHWREVFDLNQDDAWHVQGFFHYVNQNGPFTEFIYDKRDGIGELKFSRNKPYIQYF
jgi:hypothetical protein